MKKLLKVIVGPNGILPTKAYPNDMGYDLYSAQYCYIDHGELPRFIKIHTQIEIELPKGWGAFIRDRSSMPYRGFIVVGGVIDPDYRGEIIVPFMCFNEGQIQPGEKIAQLVPIPATNFDIVPFSENTLSKTARGAIGFGSSGS